MNDRLRECLLFVRDGDNRRLYWRQPQRKITRGMFKENTDESFKRTQNGSMDDPWCLTTAIFVGIGDIELLRQHHQIELGGAHLPITPLGIFQMRFDFWPVKSTFSLCDCVVYTRFFERIFKSFFSHMPFFFGAQEAFIRTSG